MTQVLRKNTIIVGWLLLFLVSSLFVFSQDNDKKELQDEYAFILQEISQLESLIKEANSRKVQSLAQLNALTAKISSRQQLMANIHTQIAVINSNIEEQTLAITKMQEDITILKEEYASMIYNSYKGMYLKNQLSFIFAAENFNQAMNRFNYLRAYAAYRETQAALLKQTIVELEQKVILLEQEKIEQTKLLEEQVAQKTLLEEEKKEQDILIEKLKDEEDALRQEAKAKAAAAETLNNKIQKIIEEEIRLTKERAATTTASSDLALTPAEKELSTSFVSNKGKLPWPVAKGHIVERFGEHPHPTLSGVKTNNSGVDIQTEEEAIVRSLFEGTVVNAFYLSATQNTVLIKHGEYYTVYSNLKTVSVKAGDFIVTKQSIGTAYTSENEGIPKVHLEIWKSVVKLNPELWLAN